MSALISWATSQSTDMLRRNAMVLIALGLGAGLASQEMTRLTGADVVADEAGVVIRVIGDKSRQVPVLRRWEDQIVEFAQEVGERPIVLPDRAKILKHAISNLVERCSRDGAPGLTVQRLRTTWIVNQMVAGTPLPALSAVSGVDSTQLARYFPLLPPVDLGETRQRIRDAGR